ncbi:alcohol dehydrogenase catalytic domain-containing protein [Arthrobacter silvisoli]|uniref:alcohol dehydrogenase catalytic domain-containing protein n=1 Tax=Arthrobacter silvisoli TaxID=2291022 RepID=UPI000E212CEF|nr:zinc-binding dehydrogenase [Arthrobacter silvisoli]
MKTAIATPDGIELRKLEQLPPGAGEVLLEVRAAGVNPVDAMIEAGVPRELGWVPADAPIGLGADVAGTVLAVGPGVSADRPELVPGTRVAGFRGDFVSPRGTFAHHAVLPAASLAVIPDALDFVGAATIPLNSSTAAQAIALAGEPSGTLLITGAAGAVGGLAVTLARRAGWRVAAFARPADVGFLEEAGAEEIVAGLGTARFDAVLDAAALGEPAVDAVADGGTYVGLVPPTLPDSDRVTTTALVAVPDSTELAGHLELAADGVLAPRVFATWPLERAAEAIAAVAAGGTRGRYVLVP